jgi:hypothetical protein
MKLECGCEIRKDNTYKKMCLNCIKTHKPDVNGLAEDKQTNCPYTCMGCGNKTGWSWIEPKHNCRNPMFDKEGNLNPNYKEFAKLDLSAPKEKQC